MAFGQAGICSKASPVSRETQVAGLWGAVWQDAVSGTRVTPSCVGSPAGDATPLPRAPRLHCAANPEPAEGSVCCSADDGHDAAKQRCCVGVLRVWVARQGEDADGGGRGFT